MTKGREYVELVVLKQKVEGIGKCLDRHSNELSHLTTSVLEMEKQLSKLCGKVSILKALWIPVVINLILLTALFLLRLY